MAITSEFVMERLLASKKAARQEIELILNGDNLTADFVSEHLRKYVLNKYFLDEECCPTDNINDIMLISLERALKIDRNLIKETEKGGACDRGTPVMTKRILLFLALQRELNIVLPPAEAAKAKTTAQLAQIVFKALTVAANK